VTEIACKKVGILTSGGDAPGMNAAVRAATLLLRAGDAEVVGVRHGYRGVLEGDFMPLMPEQVAEIIREGGTILGSTRCLEFMERAGRDKGRAKLREAGIDGLLTIGGNGTLTGAAALSDPEELGDQRLSVVGLPASIDNDIGLTGMAIGVDTAMNTIVDACDKICDTASAHDRTFLVEVMGRDCGYLAMTSAVAAAADAVLFPEADKSVDDLVQTVLKAIHKARARTSRNKRVLVIVAEGAGISMAQMKEQIEAQLKQELGESAGQVETRVTVLGHVVRGGRPSAFDRLLATRLAHVAVRALLEGKTRKMAAWLLPADLPPEVAQRSEADPYCMLVELTAVLTETSRLLSGSSPLAQWRKRIFEEVEDVLST
jgi:6-phosphofructokinase 1